jgi:hypothetical protein
MRLIQIFLPLYDNNGKRLPQALFKRERKYLLERFGGVTAYSQAPVKGLWKDSNRVSRDELVIFEVMVSKLDRRWWAQYRRVLTERFKQKELLMRAQEVTTL